jgi:hypothetical protein
MTGTTMTAGIIKIYKNGSAYKIGALFGANSGANASCVINSLVYLNGSTDYVELYGYVAAASSGTYAVSATAGEQTWFNGTLVRAA